MKQTVGYIRVSTTGQVQDGFSLPMQEAKIRAYCEFNELNLAEIIDDAGISGKNLTGRPGVQRLISLIKGKKIDAVVVYKLDRLGRSTTDLLEIAELIQKKGIILHSITEKLDTSTALGKFFFTLTASMAEMERGLISERTIVGMAQKKSGGGRVSRFAPFGYRFENDIVVKDAHEQQIITRILQLRQGGMSVHAIRTKLESECLLNRRNKPIGRNVIWSIIKKAA